MRTTITIENDAFEVANAYARARAIKLGQAVSELIRQAHQQQLPVKQINGLWVFDLPQDIPRVTAQQVQTLLDESL